MGLGDFFNAIGHASGKGRAKDNSGRSNAHVKDFPRDQLENAAASMQQPESGALGTFFDNLGSFFRPAGTFAAASYDAVGGEGALTRDIGALRKGSELYRGSDFQKSVKSIPIVGDIVDTGLRAPTGDFSKTLVGQGIDKVKELFTGVNPTNQDIFSDLSKTRIAHATEDSGFNDLARTIATNRQGQKQDNLVERTLGKLPVAGAYFDKLTPSVEDRALEAGATPEQAAFISMLNPLEWLNAESKTDAAAKLEKSGNFRKALNRIASPVVDPLQAGLDWALPGKAKAVSQGGEIPSAPVVEAKPLVENAPTDAIRQAFANNLGVDVNALPLEQVAEAARPVIDEAAKPILEEAQAAPVRPSTDAVVAPSSPVDDFVKAIAPTEAPLPSEAVQEAAAPVVEDAVKPIDYTPAPFEAAKPLVDEAPPAPAQSVPPAIAAARAALNDPNIGDAVDALDEAAPTIALERAPEAGSVVESVPSYLERLHSLAQESVDLSKKKTKGAEARLAEVRAEASQIQQNVIAALGKGEGIPLMKAYLIKAERDAAQAAKKGFALKSAMRKADAELAPLLEKLSGSDFAHLVTPSNFKAPSKQEVGSYLKAVTDEGLAQAMAQYDAKVAEIAAHPAMDEAEKASAIAFQDKLIAGVKTEIKTRQAQSVVVKEKAAPRAFKGTIQLNAGIIPSEDQLRFIADSVKGLAKKFSDNTVELRASLSRWLSSTSLGKVDAKTTTAIRDGAEASDAYSRTLADAYHKVVNGDVAGIIGSKHGGVYALGQAEKAAVRDFMGGRVVNGARVDEKALQAMGLPQDVIETAKLVRGMMDQTSDALMAETHNLPLAWFTKLNDEDRALVAGLAQTASKPKARQAFERSVSPAKLQFLNEARQKVDDGFAELSAAGHWLDGEDPRDMLLAWAPYLSNRGTYQPLLYRLFEHGVLSKGDDAMQLYIQALKGKGVNVPAEVEAFLYSNWMAGGAKSKGFGNELDRIKKRNPNMPMAIKELLQEIEDPAYSYATGLFQVNRLRHQLALRRWMAGQDKFVSQAGEDIVSFMQRNGYKNGEVVELGDNVGANTRNFGAMAGRFVHRDFWDLAFQVHALPGTAGGADAFMRFNKSILQRWKFWHTVANPASHIRQGVQNMVSIYLAGGLKAWGNMPSAISEYRTRGNLFKMARENGLLGNKSLHDIAEKIDDSAWKHLDFNAAESAIARLGNFGESIAKMSEGIRVGNERRLFSGKGAAAAWQLVDEVSRMALLKTYVDRGWPVKEAAEAVKGEVYGGVKRSRLDQMIAGIPPSSTFANLGAEGSLGAIGIKAANLISVGLNVPFWGASRFILEQSLRNFAGMKPGTWMPLTDPGRMARTAALTLGAYGLHKMMQTSEGMEPADEVEQRPDYMRPYLPMHARVPSNIMELLDDKGKVGYVDLSWALPWGGLAAGGFDPKTGSMKSRGISSQLVQISPLWKPLAEVYFNKDLFRREIGARPEIYNPLDTSASKARKSVAHLWRSYLPPWAPNLAGGALDAIRFDGGKDGRVDAKEAMRAFMQGVASDSGHTASKLASGIYNSFDYWWDKKFPDGQERLQVSDYMGREQYLVRSIADALALKITSTDLRQIEKRRKSAQTTAIKEMKHYYQLQRSNTTNPASERRLREEEAKYTQQIRAGRPVPRWYDESPEDTLRNVRQFFVEKINATR